jgi:hypothetical protein
MVTWRPVPGAVVTGIVALPLPPVTIAVMLVDPAPAPITAPVLEFTVAIPVLPLDHVAVAFGTVEPSA